MYQPISAYDVIPDRIDIQDFHKYPEDFVVRPPYQRKSVWGPKKQQALLDSLFRGYYIPKIILREVRLSEQKTVKEVVDGQQRITTVQSFFANQLCLPESLNSVRKGLGGTLYKDLDADVRKFVDKSLKYDVDLIRGISNPHSPEHQEIATEIFWRLQEGVSLNFMERMHARLSSLVRNFIVKYADDITFDYERYVPIDSNPDKHPFFSLIERSNERMEHLSILGRLLLIEIANGPADVKDEFIGELIDETQITDGIGDETYENEPHAVSLLETLKFCHKVFADDPSIDENNGIKELRTEYFIITVVMLFGYLRKYYAVQAEHYPVLRKFVYEFYQRWKEKSDGDNDILVFSDNRQQGRVDLEIRDRIIREVFFSFLKDQKIEILLLDRKRNFDELERIRNYRRADGLCQACLAEGKARDDARVSWSQYQADHIFPWIKGGRSDLQNAQVLCIYHNASKGGR